MALLSTLNSQLSAAIFTNNVTITEANTTYDGQDIIVDGATVTIDGPHSFNSVLLTNGAVLTHSPCTTTNTHKLDLMVTNEIVVSTNSRIDVSGKGYLSGRTTGNTTNGASTWTSGGSYGGLGGNYLGVANAVYGDYADPSDWGSGGLGSLGGGPGGGLVQVHAASLVLNGALLADGVGTAGSGAGGGVYLRVGVLSGGGRIGAGGGRNNSGYGGSGGGGGRVAVYAQDFSGFNTNSITALGGYGSGDGGAGTVYLRDTDEPVGTLIISGSTGGRGWTPLGLPGTNRFVIPEVVIIRGVETSVRAERPGLVLEFQNELRIEDSALVTLDGPAVVFGVPPVVRNGGRLEVTGPWTLSVPLTLTTNGVVTISGALTSTVPVNLIGGTLSLDQLVAPEVSLVSGAVLTCAAATTNQMHKLEIEVARTITVSTNSRIDVSGKGYLAGRTSGNTTIGGATILDGGSHGGAGGSTGGFVPRVYGDYADPNDWGGGGGSGNGYYIGGAGGGLVRIRATECILDGQLLANSATGAGAAGGGILVIAESLRGLGRIEAAGASGNGGANFGGGGGGRIAIHAQEFSAFNTALMITAPGARSGGAGTVYLRDTDEPAGTLIISGSTGGRGWTPLGLPGTNRFVIPEVVIIRGVETSVRAEHPGLVLEFQNELRIEDSALVTLDGSSVVFGVPPIVRNGGRLEVTGPWMLSVPLTLTTNGVVTISGALTSTVPVNLIGGTLSLDQLVAPEVSLVSGAVLTCAAATTNQMHKLELEVAGTITVSTNSRIDVSGKGYLPGRTSGNTTNGSATGLSGGSHGGEGGNRNGVSNAVYGDYADPDDWGSGGSGGPGGGLVRVHAASLVLNGALLADGVGTAGSGSGGGVYVRVGVLSGGGRIGAGGGRNNSGYGGSGGGGGRVAVYAADFSAFNTNSVTALDGFGSPGGGAGTVYLRDTDESVGVLIIGGSTGGRGWTPLGLPGTNRFVIPDAVILRGQDTSVRAEHPGLVLEFQNELRIEDSALVTLDGSSVVFGVPPVVRNNGRLEVTGPWTLNVPLTLTTNGVVTISGALTSTVPVNLIGGTLSLDQLVAPEVSLVSGAVLTCAAATTNQMHKLELEVTGTITVSTNSRIDASGKGYLPGRTSGNTTNGSATGLSGGSHGGLGGNADEGIANAVYGDYAGPEDWGAGASGMPHPYAFGNPGGGAIRLEAGQLWLNGQILADGSAGNMGGAGGSIWVNAQSLAGSGVIRAGGGSTYGPAWVRGAGGGGRVAVYAQDFSINPAGISAPGGGGNPSGGAGTVYLVQGRSHTHVRTFQPRGLNGGLVGNELPGITNRTGYMSNVLDHVTLEFNQPINTNLYDISKILMDGPSGATIPGGFVEVSNRTYQISLPLQTANGVYHFTLLPTLLDTEGFQLDQNANGIPGEPLDDVYSFTVILDTVPPRITQHAPAGDVAGTITNVDIWFSETIDPTTFSIADISILNPTNGSVSVNQIANVGFNRYRIAFPPPTLVGQYHVLISTNITDLAGNTLTPLAPTPFS